MQRKGKTVSEALAAMSGLPETTAAAGSSILGTSPMSFKRAPGIDLAYGGSPGNDLGVAEATRVLTRASTMNLKLTRQNTGKFEGAAVFNQLSAAQSRQVSKRKRVTRSCLPLVDPRTSKLLPYWDMIISLSILFTAFVTPYEVAFLPIATNALDVLFIVNRVIDAIFIFDMAINFRLVFVQEGAGDDSIHYIDNPRTIAVHYLKGWFAIDVVSIITSTVDYYTVSMGSSDGRLGSLRAVRSLRALRLIKMVTIARTSRIFKDLETRIAVDYTALELTKCIVAILASAHWFGCLWSLQANLVSEPLESWLGNYGYCVTMESTNNWKGHATLDDVGLWHVNATNLALGLEPCPDGWDCRPERPGVACRSDSTIYMAAVYWAVMTITSIGYGDIAATPYNSAEQGCCTALMLLGGVLWGYVVGTFCGTIANLSPAKREFRQTMDELNAYMKSNHVSPALRGRLREYFHRTRHIGDTESQNRLLNMMSPQLQSKVVLDVNQRWLSGVWFLAGVEAEFVVRLTLSLSPMVLAPYELAPSGFLYILCRGIIILSGELLTKGATWGEDIILASCCPSLIRLFNAKAMNYVEVFLCSWPALETALEAFPVSNAHVHKCAVRLAMRRHFIRAAALVRAERKGNGPVLDFVDRSYSRAANISASGRESAGAGQVDSFRRGNTLHRMLSKSTKATGAEVTLSTQLINVRRFAAGVAGGPGSGTIVAAAPASGASSTTLKEELNTTDTALREKSRRQPSDTGDMGSVVSRVFSSATSALQVDGTKYTDHASTGGGNAEGVPQSHEVQLAILRQLEMLTNAVHAHGTILDSIVDEMPQLKQKKAASDADLAA